MGGPYTPPLLSALANARLFGRPQRPFCESFFIAAAPLHPLGTSNHPTPLHATPYRLVEVLTETPMPPWIPFPVSAPHCPWVPAATTR